MGSILARPNPAKVAMASEFVKAAIAKDKVVIFSKSYCPYCKTAKEVRISKTPTQNVVIIIVWSGAYQI